MVKPRLLTPAREERREDDIYQEAESFVLAALDAMSAHIAILDEDGNILQVNTAWREFAQVNGFQDRTYGIGLNYLAVCDRSAQHSSRDAARVAQGIRDVMGQQISEFYMEYPCHSPSERRWYVVRVTRFDWYGHIRLIVAHQNVTELKSVQIKLEENQARIQAILDNVADGIITLDGYGVIETANAMAEHIFEYEPGTLVGKNIESLLAQEYHLADQGYTSEFMVSLNRMGHEILGRRSDGSLFPMYIALTRLQLERRPLFTGIVQDITERKRLEAEIIERERLAVALDKERELRLLKDRFMSMMSHELRTPLASIRLASDMLKKYGDRASETEKQEAIENIEAQVNYLSELVSDVLTISKTEFMSQDMDMAVSDLETYLRDIIEELEWTYSATHTLIYDGVGRRVDACFDRRLLRHAINNLLTNAIKYSPAGGEVRLSLRLDGRDAVIQVCDQGIGIPEQDIPRLFEPFHRAENVDKFQGTGDHQAEYRPAPGDDHGAERDRPGHDLYAAAAHYPG
jgi:PAS domain S-box-containing protein